MERYLLSESANCKVNYQIMRQIPEITIRIYFPPQFLFCFMKQKSLQMRSLDRHVAHWAFFLHLQNATCLHV